MSDTISVFGIGNPLMDFVVNAGDDFIDTLGAKKGTMLLIDKEEKERLLSLINDYKNIPGGSCANTLRGIAWLRRSDHIHQPLYSGAVGRDDVGQRYISMMEKDFNILPRIPQKEKATGLCIAIVTPDFERTMFTYLGACEEYAELDVDYALLEKARVLHFTGYMWGTESEKDAIQKASQFCQEKGVLISFDLADPLMVKFHRDPFIRWIPDYVDILFGNEEEISMLMGKSGDHMDIIKSAGSLAPLVIMKTGPKGCLVNDKGNIISVPGIKVNAIDTVGAGDSFAAGFLYGYTRGLSINKCSEIANRLAAGIVTVEGCDYSKLDQADILTDL